MEIPTEKKVDILLTALEERYASIHRIRDRVQSIGIWALGLLLGAGGWVLQNGSTLTCSQKTLSVLGVVSAFIVLRFVYLEDLRNGFRGQQRAMVRLEEVLGFFTPGVFDKSDGAVYPEKWKHSGSQDGDGKFFDTTYALLYVGVAFLILTILFSVSFPQYLHFYPRYW